MKFSNRRNSLAKNYHFFFFFLNILRSENCKILKAPKSFIRNKQASHQLINFQKQALIIKKSIFSKFLDRIHRKTILFLNNCKEIKLKVNSNEICQRTQLFKSFKIIFENSIFKRLISILKKHFFRNSKFNYSIE